MPPKSIKRKDGPPPEENLAKPVSEVHSGMSPDGTMDEDIIEIDLGGPGIGPVTKARARAHEPPSTT